jgi:hypothetical protein
VPFETLTRSSSGSHELLVAVSEVLGMILSEVCDMYFGDRSEVKRDRFVVEAREHRQEDCEYEED